MFILCIHTHTHTHTHTHAYVHAHTHTHTLKSKPSTMNRDELLHSVRKVIGEFEKKGKRKKKMNSKP